MPRTLYLVRHGIAENVPPGGSDEDRRLTERGTKQMHRAAAALRRLGVEAGLVLCSPLIRARQTAGILAANVAPGSTVRLCPELAPGHGPEAVFPVLAEHTGDGALMLVGHQPTMGELASLLLTGSPGLVPLPFRPGAVAAIDVPALPPDSPGSLRWFVAADQLEALES